jgi:hypothetical protein
LNGYSRTSIAGSKTLHLFQKRQPISHSPAWFPCASEFENPEDLDQAVIH